MPNQQAKGPEEQIFEQLLVRWDQLQARWKEIDQAEFLREFPAQREASRLEATGTWKASFLTWLEEIRRSVLPKLREERAKSSAAAQQLLASGKLGLKPPRNPLLGLVDEQGETWRAHDTESLVRAAGQALTGLLEGLDALQRTISSGNNFQMRDRQTTEELAATVDEYRRLARNGFDTFPWPEWNLDRTALGVILRSRAAVGDDNRAGMVAEQVAEIEELLIGSKVGSAALLTQLDRTIAQVTEAAAAIRGNDTSQLADMMAGLERSVQRAAGVDPLAGMELRQR